jgi:uncharacterized protein
LRIQLPIGRALSVVAVHSHRGAIFETFIASEIMKSAFHSGKASSLHFWRDRSGNEIDFLIDLGSDLLPIEAKSGKTVASDWFDGLKTWRAFAGDRAQPGMLLYGGDKTYAREGLAVTSWRKAGQLHRP